jgi:hypothetical protein
MCAWCVQLEPESTGRPDSRNGGARLVRAFLHFGLAGTWTGTGMDSQGATRVTFFAAGADSDPTPAGTSTLTGSASDVVADQRSTAYSGSDSCEGCSRTGRCR